MKLLLWDIDGTLVCTGRAGDAALRRAVKSRFGVDDDLKWIDYRGRTDSWIARQMLEHFGHPETEEGLQQFMEAYLESLADELPRREGKTHAGIVNILETVHQRTDLKQGLLTGNLVRGAELKLTHYNVWHYFEFGAFANDSHIRNELGPVALARAEEKHGYAFRPEDTYIIGDTPNDIACGQIIGAKTIAVATGGFSVEELASYNPTAVLPDFSNPADFFKAVNA